MRFLLQFCDETCRQGISVHSHADAQKSSGTFFGVFPGKVPEIGMRPQKRAESVLGGTDKGCYGKCAHRLVQKAPQGFFAMS